MAGYSVEVVDPEITYPLRQAVLRPYLSVEQVAEQDSGAMTFAALDGDGVVLCCASLLVDDPAPAVVVDRAAQRHFRLRYMATDPAHRGAGVGAAVLTRLMEEITGRGGGVLWCNAREGAVGFYEKLGFVAVGEPFVEEPIGQHIVMWRPVDARTEG